MENWRTQLEWLPIQVAHPNLGFDQNTKVIKTVQRWLIDRVGGDLNGYDGARIQGIIEEPIRQSGYPGRSWCSNRVERAALLDQIKAEITGFGPVELLLPG